MKTSKILLGTIAGGVTFFLLGWLVYGILLMDYSAENYNQCMMNPMEEMNFGALFLSNLAYALLFALVFKWSNTSGMIEGAKIGGIIGLLVASSFDLSMYSMSSMFNGLSAVIVDILVYTVISAIIGGVVALVMGMGKKEA